MSPHFIKKEDSDNVCRWFYTCPDNQSTNKNQQTNQQTDKHVWFVADLPPMNIQLSSGWFLEKASSFLEDQKFAKILTLSIGLEKREEKNGEGRIAKRNGEGVKGEDEGEKFRFKISERLEFSSRMFRICEGKFMKCFVSVKFDENLPKNYLYVSSPSVLHPPSFLRGTYFV